MSLGLKTSSIAGKEHKTDDHLVIGLAKTFFTEIRSKTRVSENLN